MEKQKFVLKAFSILIWVISILGVMIGLYKIIDDEFIIGLYVLVGASINLLFGYVFYYILENTINIIEKCDTEKDEQIQILQEQLKVKDNLIKGLDQQLNKK